MSALDEIITEYGRVARDHPDAIGEILRAWAFTGEGTGCYSTFDVRPEFVAVPPTIREFGFLWGRDFREDDINPSDWGYCDTDAIKEISWFKHSNGIEMGWHWDGDGSLAFYVPELEDEWFNGVVCNHDCKCDHDWRFGERK